MYELNFTTALTYAEVETDAGKGQSKRRRQVPWRCLWKQWKQRQNGQKPLESRWEAIGKPLGSHWKAIGYTGKLYDVPNFKCGNVCSLLFTDI